MNKYTTTISFDFELSPIEDLEVDDLCFHLQDQFYNWSDGRYPLSVELLKKSIKDCLDSAIYEAIENRDTKRYSGEYYSIKNGQVAKFLYTAKRAYRRVKLWLGDEVKCEVKSYES